MIDKSKPRAGGVIRLDLTGRAFGQLTAVRCDGKTSNGRNKWFCQCECGNGHVSSASFLLRGLAKSCGCVKKVRRYGQSLTSLYHIWSAMKQRCLNRKNRAWASYGGRGIGVCDAWLDFENFAKDMAPRPAGKSLDRTDNNRGYEPGNCRWVDVVAQSRNRRSNHLVTIGGRTRTTTEWAIEHGISPSAAMRRMCLGWPDELAVTLPIAQRSSLKQRTV